MNRKKQIIVTFTCLFLLLEPAASMAGLKDKLEEQAMKSVKLVVETEWEDKRGEIKVVSQSESDEEHAEEFAGYLGDWIEQAFEEKDFVVNDSASTVFFVTVNTFSTGTQWKKLVTGFLGGGLVTGTVIVTMNGNQVGSYQFSSKLRGGITAGSVDAMAKEVGPPMILKVLSDKRDKKLHKKKK